MAHRRFDRTSRLLGDSNMDRLARSYVAVFGCGGVGSFAAEALVRSGVGRLLLVDYDRVCVTNINRQLHALRGTYGKPKVEVMAERLRLINPDAVIETRTEFYGAESSARLLTPEPDVVIDAIDNMTAKMHLIVTCARQKMRIVSSMGAAARLDPTLVRVADLSETHTDPFAKALRKHLRRNHGMNCQQHTGVWAVYSEEAPVEPVLLGYDAGAFQCVCPGGQNGMNDCDHGYRVEGSIAWVPSMFGMTVASTVVRLLLDWPAVGAVPERELQARGVPAGKGGEDHHDHGAHEHGMRAHEHHGEHVLAPVSDR